MISCRFGKFTFEWWNGVEKERLIMQKNRIWICVEILLAGNQAKLEIILFTSDFMHFFLRDAITKPLFDVYSAEKDGFHTQFY